MELHLTIIGYLLMTLALGHSIFPRYFDWAEDLKSLQLINRQMMIVHTIFIALFVFVIGALCASSAMDLVHTILGRRISLALGLVWLIRLIFQLFVYSPKLWRGKRMETTVHVLFTLFWTYLACVFLTVGLAIW